MADFSEDYYLTIKELAKRYNCSTDGIYKRIRRGAFPPGVLLGHQRRWLMSEVLAWEDAQRQAQAPQAKEEE